MSIKVVLCENDKYMLEVNKNLLLHIAEKYQIKMDIEIYQNDSELIFLAEDKDINTWDMLILNSDFKTNNGIEIVKILEKNGCTAEVLFLSSDETKALESFSVNPFYYFVREKTTIDEFERVMVRCLEVIKSKQNNIITINSPNKFNRLNLSEIEYFKVNHRIVSVYSNGTKLGSFYGNLQQVEDKLKGKEFIRIYRSYIVNIKAIDVIKKMELVTFSNTVIPISNKYRKKLLNEITMHGDINCMNSSKKECEINEENKQ